MKNVYLIFPNYSDVYSNVTITCTREKLNDVLIEIELLEEENPKAKLILEFEDTELTLDEWNIESSDELVTIKFIEK